MLDSSFLKDASEGASDTESGKKKSSRAGQFGG